MKWTINRKGTLWIDELGNSKEILHIHYASSNGTCYDHEALAHSYYKYVHLDRILCTNCKRIHELPHHENEPAYVVNHKGSVVKKWYYRGELIFKEVGLK